MLYLYFAVTFAVLAGLGGMILTIARVLGDCPENSRRARAAGVSITTGFLAIGGGGVRLIATFPALTAEPGMGIFAMGLACVILGPGFTQAVTTLRATVGPAPKPVPMEPVPG